VISLTADNGKHKVSGENAKLLQDKINVIENKLSRLYLDKAKSGQK
jgi:hypothetical protein